MYELNYFAAAKKEYEQLDGSQKIQVDKALNKIKAYGTEIGKQLSGNLSTCFEIKQRRLGLRIVFQANAESILIINIIAIGKRADNQVFDQAADRLQ